MVKKDVLTKEIENWLQEEIEAVFPWLGAVFLEVSLFFEEKKKKKKIIKIDLQQQLFYLTINLYPKFKKLWKQKEQKILRRVFLLELAKIPIWDLVTLVQHPFKTFEEFEQVEERTVSLINFYTLNLIDLNNFKFPKLPLVKDKNSLKKWIKDTIDFLTPIMHLPKIKLAYQFFEAGDEVSDICCDFDSKTQRFTFRIYPYFMKNWKERNKEYLASALTHELAHLHTHKLTNILYSPKEKKGIEKIKDELTKTIFYFLNELRNQSMKPIRFLKASD